MIQIEDIVVSSDIITEKFLCNLEACKGECCIEGDAGAPVEESGRGKRGEGIGEGLAGGVGRTFSGG